MDRKQELRMAMMRIRASLNPAEVARASAAVTRKVLALPAFREAGTVLAYMDVRNEIQTGALIRATFDAGRRVAVPVTDRERRRLIAARITGYPIDLESGPYGIPQPRRYEEIPPGELDCILVPGLAFDYRGYRLGFGGGYYDRFLPRVRDDAVLIGLAYDFQICPTVYPEAHDRAVHVVITETRILDIRGGPRSK
jgi:5-formyltetrahydrofolate cyclo-ligase